MPNTKTTKKKPASEKPLENPDLAKYGSTALKIAEQFGLQPASAFAAMLDRPCDVNILDEEGRPKKISTLPGINLGNMIEGPSRARVMLVAPWPNPAEANQGRLFCGDWTEELDAICAKTGFPKDQCYLTTYVPYPQLGKKAGISKELIEDFAPALKRQVELVKPELVIMLGSKVLKAVMGAKATAEQLKGRTLPAADSPLGVKTALVMDFSSIQYMPENRSQIALEMGRLAQELQSSTGSVQDDVECDYSYCRDLDSLKAKIDEAVAETTGWMSVDCEWGGNNPQDGYLRCVQFSWSVGKAMVAVLHDAGKTPTELELRKEETWAEIRRLLDGQRLIGHFIRADLPWLQHNGVDISYGAFGGWDTGLAGHLLNENWPQGLEVYTARYTNMGRYDLPLSSWIKANKYSVEDQGYGGIPSEILLPYAAADADATFRIFLRQVEEMDAPGNEKIANLFRTIVMPATLPILEMETTGMLLDQPRLTLLAQKYGDKRAKLAKRLQDLLNWPEFNPDSSAQKALALFGWSKPGSAAALPQGVQLRRFTPISATDGRKWEDVLKRPDALKTASPSTDKESITSLRLLHPQDEFLEVIQLYSAVSQTVKTFTGTFQELPDGSHTVEKGLMSKLWPDGRIHCRIRQTVETGRYGHSDPNMAQMPKTAEGLVAKAFKDDPNPPPSIRSCFMEQDGWCLIDCDWKQAELFAMAWLSNDASMQTKLLDPNADFHSEVAVEMFRLERPPADYSKGLKDWLKEKGWVKFRTIAKTIVFGIAYGRGAAAVAGAVRLEGIEITHEEAQNAIDKFKKTFPQLAKWLESLQEAVGTRGYVENGFGRRRRFEATSDPEMQAHQRRQAMNAPIQGTVGDLMSLALVNMYSMRLLERPHLRFKATMSVHDQILVACPVEEVDETLEVISASMCERCRIPGSDLLLAIDPEICVRWGEPLSKEDITRYPSLAKYAK